MKLIKELIEIGEELAVKLDEVAPPGFEGTVKAMKKHKKISNPFALAWYMKGKGKKSHIKEAKESTIDKILDDYFEENAGDMFEEEGGISYDKVDHDISDIKKTSTKMTFVVTVSGNGNDNYESGDSGGGGHQEIDSDSKTEIAFNCELKIPVVDGKPNITTIDSSYVKDNIKVKKATVTATMKDDNDNFNDDMNSDDEDDGHAKNMRSRNL